MKEEALKLADELDLIARMIAIGDRIKWGQDSELMENGSSMIRRLVEELDKHKDMLAKHQDIIADWDKKPLSDGEIDESFDRTASHMANEYVSHYEPTAWINHIKQTGGDFYELNVSGRGEPLYRHPPQTKPLSEKELYEVFDKCYPNNGDGDVVTLVDFARAIEERHGIK